MLAVWPSWFQSWWTEEHEEWAPDSAFSCGEASWSWAGSWETSRKESVKEYLRKGSAGAENRMLGNKSRTMRRHSRSTARTWASPEDRRDGAPVWAPHGPEHPRRTGGTERLQTAPTARFYAAGRRGPGRGLWRRAESEAWAGLHGGWIWERQDKLAEGVFHMLELHAE